MTNKELECKKLLTYEEYQKLLIKLVQVCDGKETICQTNHYYDTSDFDLNKKGETLRVRQKDERYTVEYKSKKVMINGVRLCDEYSKEIGCAPVSIDGKLIGHAGKEYFLIGKLTTHRENYSVSSCVVSLDINSYMDIVDYEVEIEADRMESIPYVISMLGLTKEEPSFGKYSRFVNRFRSVGNL